MNAISGNIDQLATALAKAQGEIAAAKLDGANPHFKSKYGTLASFWESIRSPLSKNGLAVSQVMDAEHGEMVTILMHASGQYITSTYAIRPQQDTPQGWGSAITYARRYCLAAIVGAVADDDDDGNAASQRKQQVDPATGEVKDVPPPAPPVASNGNGNEPMSEVQRKALHAVGSDFYGAAWNDKRPELVKAVTEGRSTSSSDLTNDEAAKLISGLRKRVNARNAEAAKTVPVEQESMLEDAAAANPQSAYSAGL